MSFLSDLKAEPWRFDYFAVLRRLERAYKDLPRISDSAARREEFVQFGQETYMEFPASNIARVVQGDNKQLTIFVKFLGLLGPQGALPLSVTEEAYHYHLARDDAFPRFLDIFNNRFIQLFFRAWADSRSIAQHDRPDEDRFVAYLGSAIGVGSKPYQHVDSLPDSVRIGFAGLLGSQIKSASRLAGAVCGMFKVQAEVEQFVGARLEIEAAEYSLLGRRHTTLGEDALLGSTVFSVQDKIRIRIFTRDLKQYSRFLPSGDLCEPLADLVFFYNGDQLDWDAELALPSGSAAPVRLGHFGQLGWTSWMAPNWTASEAWRRDARFHPAERIRLKRRRAAEKKMTANR